MRRTASGEALVGVCSGSRPWPQAICATVILSMLQWLRVGKGLTWFAIASYKRVVGSSLRNKVAKVREREAGRLYLYTRGMRDDFGDEGYGSSPPTGRTLTLYPNPITLTLTLTLTRALTLTLTLTLEPVWMGSG